MARIGRGPDAIRVRNRHLKSAPRANEIFDWWRAHEEQDSSDTRHAGCPNSRRVGPRDVFTEANVQAGSDFYQLRVFGSVLGAIRSSSGVSLMPDAVIGSNLNEKIDTLLVVGVPNGIEAWQ